MIRKLNSDDNDRLMKFIGDEPEFNLYIISDIENFGYDKDFQEMFGEFSEEDELVSVLVRYFNIYTVYAKGEFDVHEYASIMNEKGYGMLSGKTEIVSMFEDTDLKLDAPELHHFAALTREGFQDLAQDKSITVKKASLKDIDRIVELNDRIEEFSGGSGRFGEILENEYKTGTGHGYYIKVDRKIVSYAQVSAENSKCAMVVSVMTDSAYRGRGLASACVTHLCREMLARGKTLCLFYKNPEAGSIYRKVGFKDIGFWSMYRGKV